VGAHRCVLIQANLLCGSYELFTQLATPAGFIVNDYVEVAKAFYDAPIPGLVHAVLDRLGKLLRPVAE
jgi:transcription antitermination protein NusB